MKVESPSGRFSLLQFNCSSLFCAGGKEFPCVLNSFQKQRFDFLTAVSSFEEAVEEVDGVCDYVPFIRVEAEDPQDVSKNVTREYPWGVGRMWRDE